MHISTPSLAPHSTGRGEWQGTDAPVHRTVRGSEHEKYLKARVAAERYAKRIEELQNEVR
jgi:hypothetical protein